VATLAEMGRQRRETIDTLLVERATVLADLANERAIMLAAVDEERRLAMRDVDSLRIRIVADEIHVVDHVIDHLMLRLAELLGGLVVLIGVFLLLLRRRAAA
jgi:hypothetical protein